MQVFVEVLRVKSPKHVMHLAGSAAEHVPQLLVAVQVAEQASLLAVAVVPVKTAASASLPLPSVQAVHVPMVSVPVLADR